MSKTVKRLFEQFQPEHYELSLVPDAVKMTFSGSVTISGRKTGRPSQRLTFHQKGLSILAAKITYHGKKGDEHIPVERINCHGTFNEVRLHVKNMLYPGSYSVNIDFDGKLDGDISHILQKILDSKKSFVPAELGDNTARKIFPCIDEPDAKTMVMIESTPPKKIEY